MKVNTLIFNTDFLASFGRHKLENGKIIIGEKEFDVDKTKPFLLKKKLFGFIPFAQPLYILKWDSYVPAHYERVTSEGENGEIRKELKLVDLKFLKNKIYTPEFHKGLTDMKFLKNMSKYASEKKGMNMGNLIFILLLIAGGVVAFLMFGTGII